MDIIYTDEGITESVELKPEGVDNVEDKVGEIFFFGLSVKPSE
jgi:hypothetical protein